VIGAYRVKPTKWEATRLEPEDAMTTTLRQQ